MSGSKNALIIPDEVILNKIYLIRELKVMLDSDLADLYGVETKVLKQQEKRNINRFPEDFMFELTNEEFANLRSQFVTSSWGGCYMPMVFTEQGMAMLSSILRSEQAVKVNIQMLRIFTKVRHLLINNLSVKLEIEDIKKKLVNQDKNIEPVFSYLDELIEEQRNPKLPKQMGFRRNKS